MLNNAKHQAKNSPSLPILGYDGIALKLSKQIRVRKRFYLDLVSKIFFMKMFLEDEIIKIFLKN